MSEGGGTPGKVPTQRAVTPEQRGLGLGCPSGSTRQSMKLDACSTLYPNPCFLYITHLLYFNILQVRLFLLHYNVYAIPPQIIAYILVNCFAEILNHNQNVFCFVIYFRI